MIYIAPSLLAADFANLQSEIKQMADAGANKLPKAWAHCKKPPLL